MRVEPQQLKAFLVDSGLISGADLEKIEKEAQKNQVSLNNALTKSGKVSEEDLSRLEGYILGVPFVNLENEKIDFKTLSYIPEPIARTHNIISFKKTGTDLEVAMLDPQDLETIDFIKKQSNLRILPRLTTKNSIKNVLKQYHRSLQAEFGEIIKQEGETFEPFALQSADGIKVEVDPEELKKMAEDLPVVRIVDTLLKHAILQRASDIHIEPYEKEIVVRYRIDGILRDAMTLPKEMSDSIVARIKILSNLRLDEKRLPQDGRFKIENPEEKVSFRVSILPVYNGEKAVMRLLRENSKGFSLELLGFFGEQLEMVHKAITAPNGMLLATGPTGCGKTTTLYTVLDILNTPDVNISTIEDPIEYQIPRINQTQVKPAIGFTFANGLRSLVRQDPDIIMVGEIRDNETASLAVNAALTGHLVLSTLHTNSAAGAIARLVDMKVEPFLLTSTLNVIIAQRLVRRLCRSKKGYKLQRKELENLVKGADLDKILNILKSEKIISPKTDWDQIEFFKPAPDQESPDGYKDRIGIHEVLYVSSAIKELILKNTDTDSVHNQARKEGMLTMFEDGILKAAQGITSLEEVLRATKEE